MISKVALGLTTVGFALLPATADAFTLKPSSEPANVLFAAEGRIARKGDNNKINTGLNSENKFNKSGNFDYLRNNNNSVDFTFNYDSTAGKSTFKVGGATVEYNVGKFLDLNTIVFRARSTEGSSVLISDLFLNDEAVNGDAFSNTGQDGASYFEISGVPDDFTLKGKTTLSFDKNNPPRNSALAYQFKVTNKPENEEAVSVPEPGTVLGILVSAGALGAVRRNKKSAVSS